MHFPLSWTREIQKEPVVINRFFLSFHLPSGEGYFGALGQFKGGDVGLEGGLAGMIEGLFMLCGVRPAVWGESGAPGCSIRLGSRTWPHCAGAPAGSSLCQCSQHQHVSSRTVAGSPEREGDGASWEGGSDHCSMDLISRARVGKTLPTVLV